MINVKENTIEVVEKLAQLGFFKYVQTEKLTIVKEAVQQELSKDLSLMSLRSDNGDIRSINPGLFEDVSVTIDKRCFHADAENIAELGANYIVASMKPLLIANGIQCNTLDTKKENDKYYLIWDNDSFELFDTNSGEDSWQASSRNLLNIINQKLQAAGSPEKCYFRTPGGNDQDIVVLTDELYNYIQSLDIKSLYKQFSPTPSL